MSFIALFCKYVVTNFKYKTYQALAFVLLHSVAIIYTRVCNTGRHYLRYTVKNKNVVNFYICQKI